jgi:DNA mismatch repair protein MutL
MPPRIHALPTLVVNQIAAGEVIERPASVVKELLENAVDADSSRIEIDVEHGGQDLIRIVDNGCGIHADDLALAFASHATSKLYSAEDLFSIGTFGFRGEALASIGGVAHVVLQSRPPESLVGTTIECKGSVLSPIRTWNGAPGTRIEVRQLFFNTPVRRKFLRTPATEMSHISEAVTRLSLAHSRTEDHDGLHVVLRHNNKLVYEVTRTAELRERIELFFGSEVAKPLYEIEASAGPVRLHGYIADPSCDRGNARMQYLFVNGRWVRDRSLGHAVQEAYRGLLMTGRYAISFLFLDLPADHVDVNVHPTKSEVRFRHSQSLHHLIYTTLKRRLAQANLTPRLQTTPSIATPVPAPRTEFRVVPHEESYPRQEESTKRQVVSAPLYTETPQLPLFDHMDQPRALQLYDAYLVVETDEGMLVIDQHALHERILYEQFKRRVQTGSLQTQALLIPEPIDLPSDAAARTLEHRDALADLGLGIEAFGGGTILLTRYPVLLGRRSPSEALLAVVDHLLSQDRPPAREVLFNDLLSLMACHAAVRAGERLNPEQISELLAQRHLADDHHHCPHGRPTALLFTRHDLERQFKRA